VLEGKLPDGTEVPVCPFDEFKRGIANQPQRYGMARYDALAPRDVSTSLRYLGFEV
jgi:hypothetical protein